ncbi:MAG: glycosyltransferase [Bacteroidales bacterium]|nr:glycosyltransferase [Bacteroidales bacterium]
MKILVIPSWYPPNGGSFFKDQCEALTEAGVEVHVLVTQETSLKKITDSKSKPRFRVSYNKEGPLLVVRKKLWRIPKNEKQNVRRWIRMTIRTFDDYFKKYGAPDLIHAHSVVWGGFAATLIKKKYNIPVVVTEHRGRFNANSKTHQKEIKTWHKPLIKNALENIDLVIPVSKLLIPTMSSFTDKEVKFRVIPNMANSIYFEGSAKKEQKEKTVLFTLTNFLEYKGIGIMLKAFKKALDQSPDIILFIAGEGQDENKYKRMADELGIEKHVSFLGYLSKEKVKDELLKADYMILSSLNEAQPVSIIEAFAAGTPVIVTDVISDDVVTPETGIIVQSDSIESFTEGILQGIKFKDRFKEPALKEHARRFEDKQIISQITDCYHTIFAQ